LIAVPFWVICRYGEEANGSLPGALFHIKWLEKNMVEGHKSKIKKSDIISRKKGLLVQKQLFPWLTRRRGGIGGDQKEAHGNPENNQN
jgi:hypothetical protein